MWNGCLIHAANMILLQQRLIPEDVDTNISYAFDHLITTFYATGFKFAWMVTEKGLRFYTDTKKISMIPTRTAIFVAVYHLLLDLHSRFGMVLPICKVMEESCPSMYKLLTPDKDDLEKYSKLKWIKRLERDMKNLAQDMRFEAAIEVRDKIRELKGES